MSAEVYHIHASHPEPQALARVAAAVERGAIVGYPTDTVYALGCDPRAPAAIERLRKLKPALRGAQASPLTILCPSLDCIARYAHVDSSAYRLLRALTPGPYTFILHATKEVPKLLLNPKRRTVGMRVPKHAFCQELVKRLDGLLITTSAKLDSGDEPQTRDELMASLENKVDVLVDDDEPLHDVPSTIIDLTGSRFEVVREGQGMEKLRQYLY